MHENDEPAGSGRAEVIASELGIPPDLVTITAAARLAGKHQDTLRRWVKQGRLRMWGWPGSERVSLSEVLPSTTSRRSKAYYTPDGRAPAFRNYKPERPDTHNARNET